MKYLSLFVLIFCVLTTLYAQDETTSTKQEELKEEKPETSEVEASSEEAKSETSEAEASSEEAKSETSEAEASSEEAKPEAPKEDKKWATPITHYSETGLMYAILKEGAGETPQKGDIVVTHYTGKFLSGKVFDSSVERDMPFEFLVGTGQVIKGWDEALGKMKKGEKRLLVLPPHLAYGTKGAGNVIPPNSVLIFEVELLDFQSK